MFWKLVMASAVIFFFLLLWLFYVGFCIHEDKVGCSRSCYVTNAKKICK